MNSELYYTGRECKRHPELKGLRRKYNYRCLKCEAMYTMRTSKNRVKKKGTRYFGKICKKHPIIKGERFSLNCKCVACHRIRVIKSPAHQIRKKWHSRARRQKMEQSIPKWVNPREIAVIYKEAKQKGLTVDHIIPLRGALVSGLHCPANLQLLTKAANLAKGNSFGESLCL